MSWFSSSGLRSWMIQRLSAVYLAVFLPLALAVVVLNPPSSFQQWHDLLSHPLVNSATGLFFLALLLHAWVGLRDVILDYVKPFSFRLVILMLIGLVWLGMGLWVLRSLMLLTT